MKNESAYAKTFGALFKRLKAKYEGGGSEARAPVEELVLSFLQWEATAGQARAAYEKLMSRVVDHNDLRVSQREELAAALGARYPLGEERVRRLQEALQGVFLREHAVGLSHLSGMTKKQARAYLDGLPEMPPYVAARVTLVCFQGHAVPVDETLARLLREQKAVDPSAGVAEIEAFLSRQVRAAEALEAHRVLQAWSDAGGQAAAGGGRVRAGGAGGSAKKASAKASKGKAKSGSAAKKKASAKGKGAKEKKSAKRSAGKR